MAEKTQQISGEAGLPGRYATAIFELAREAGKLDAVAGDLGKLRTLIEESPDLTRLVRSPVFSRAEQGKAMAAIMQRLGADDLSARFVALVASKRRLFALPAIITTFNAMLARLRGETVAQVISAHALDKSQMDAIAAALKEAAGREVQIQASVDNGILGGLIVRMGSRMIDGSLRTKLNNLQIAMKEVG
ncbi:MAG TPA: F0F1 ATP synthase subunit delta [Alphaproteobacteria bacterium]|nr:F0F1 ATP synthase subunit delta [Alphaproteobacteria bacterium]